MELILIFLTGLTVGGLTCLAVQGSLLAALISTQEKKHIDKHIKKTEEQHVKQDLKPTAAFLTAKIISHTLLGFLLGAIGERFVVSDNIQIMLQLLVGIYVIAVALNLLNVHPIFRYAIIQPPRFLTKLVNKQTQNTDMFAPIFLGAMTVFIPCGTTLAMETLALSSGSAIYGALIMLAFTLGTVPLFFGLGYITTIFGITYKNKFLKFAAYVLIFLGLQSIDGALVAFGSPVSFTVLRQQIPPQISWNNNEAKNQTTNTIEVIDGKQTATIKVLSNGYKPNYIKVKANQPVRLYLETTENMGCTALFKIPKLGISENLFQTGGSTVEFTPTAPGKITWTCSMGMYTGVIEVI